MTLNQLKKNIVFIQCQKIMHLLIVPKILHLSIVPKKFAFVNNAKNIIAYI